MSLNKAIHSVALTVTNRTRCSDKLPLTRTKYTYRRGRLSTIMLKFTSPQFTLPTPSFGDQALWRPTRSFGNPNRWRNYEARGSRCYVSDKFHTIKGAVLSVYSEHLRHWRLLRDILRSRARWHFSSSVSAPTLFRSSITDITAVRRKT